MAKISFKKILSFLMALCMIMSLFTCVSILPASATTSDYMFYINGSNGDSKQVMFRHNSQSDHPDWEFKPNTKYTFSCRLKLESSISPDDFYWKLLRIYYYNTSDAKTKIDKANVVETYDANTLSYSVTFTVPSDCRSYSNTEIRIGDPGWNGYVYKIWIADLSLKAEGSSIDMMPEIKDSNTKVANAVSAENKYVLYNSKTYVNVQSKGNTFPEIVPEQPETPTEPDSYNDGAAKTIRFVSGVATKLHYYNNNRTLEAGDYELGFDWNTIYGEGAYLKLIVGGNVVSEQTYGTEDADEFDENTYAEDRYTASNSERVILFTLDDDATGIEIVIGTADGTTSMYVANAYLKVVDGDSGEATGNNLINNITESTYNSTKDATDNKKWNREGGRNGGDSGSEYSIRVLSYNADVFNGADLTRRVTFNNYTWRLIRYHDYKDAGIKAGTTYKFALDYRRFSETDLTVRIKADGTTVASSNSDTYKDTLEVDKVNRKLYLTFTATADADALEITIGNEDYEGIASIGHATLYALDADGNAVGNSLIDDINTQTLDLTYSSTTYDRVWNTRGYGKADDGIYIDAIPTGYFSANTDTDKAAYFPAGSDSYQVLAYKDANVYMPKGTYQLTIDIAKLAGEPTVQLRTGVEIGDVVSATSVTNEGTKYTYTYTLSANARGVGLFIGNYGKGANMAVLFKNAAVYRVVDGEVVGENLIEPLNDRTYDWHDYKGTRANALNTKWTPVNCNSSLFKLVNIDSAYFEGDVVTTGTPYMAIFNQGYSWRVLEYNDAYKALEKDKTYVLTIDERDVTGNPTVKLYDSSNNEITKYTSSYTDEKNGTTRTITFTMASTTNSLRIRVGNYSDDTNVSAKYANVKLVELGSDTNLIAGFSKDTMASSAENRKWRKAQYAYTGNLATFYTTEIPEGYFENELTDKMFYISDITTNAKYGNTIVNTGANLEAGKTYTLELDWSAYKGLDPAVYVTYKYAQDSWKSLGLADFDGDFGHYTVTFTMPDDAVTDSIINLQIGVGADIKNDDYVNYGRGSVYFGNFSLKAEGSDANILTDGNLKLASEGDFTKSTAWNVGVAKNNGSRDMYGDLKVLEQPENFFTAEGAKAEKMVKFNGGSYDYIRQQLVLENNTTYRLTYNYSFVNAVSTQFIELIDENSDFTTATTDSSSFDKATRTRTVEFTTLENMRDRKNNAQISFLIESKGVDVKFNFGNIKLYKVVDGETVGHNLINNGGFYFGDEITLDDELKSEIKDQRSTGILQLLGWEISGTFASNTNVQIVNMTEDSFPAVIPAFAERLTNIRLILVGKREASNNAFEDLNNDSKVTLIDLVKSKKLAAAAKNTNGAEDEAKAWKSIHLNGNNATDTSKITGTIYYVDAVNGNDNNDGKSPEKAWKSISTVNNASLSSGDAVLFKCGQVWRPSSVAGTDVLKTKNGVTYGAYGTGAKPQILGSYLNYATREWEKVSDNVWKTSIGTNGASYAAGIVVYDGELIGSMTKTRDDLATANVGDFCHYEVVDNVINTTDRYVYVNCPSNPAEYWKDIEIGVYRSVVSLASNVTMDNIAVMYTGYHGMDSGSGVSGITIQNCAISYIGGSYNEKNRLGNGIQFGISGENLVVKDTYVSECYDAGITFQTWSSISGNGYWRNLSFTNNLVENCNYAFEWFNLDETPVENIVIDGNIFRGAGYGWSYDERVGYGEDLGIQQTSLFRVGQDVHYTDVANFQITNNLFDSSKKGLVYWWWNEEAATTTVPMNRDIYNISGNSFYQEMNSENLVMIFETEGYVQGISSYGVKEALKKFEGVDEPIGEAEAVITDDTILVE